jgi:hypothetical protein
LPTLAGAGALRSTSNDLLKFMTVACLSEASAPLRPAFDLLLKTRRSTDSPMKWRALAGLFGPEMMTQPFGKMAKPVDMLLSWDSPRGSVRVP